MYFNPSYKDKADDIIQHHHLGQGVEVLGDVGVSKPYETENVSFGNSQDYKIAKLKRDFGENEVMEAIADNGYTKATNQIS